ncbi:hypothetical protein GGR57DRAFT_260174 [Xylariaceae sp. FL1272]|nr:hypothetical protein GGR57DRAFT_260174 [Xylariaceae sp. FL1272]
MPSNMQPSSRLFALPEEIRDHIYGFYLSPTYDDFVDTQRPQLFLDGVAFSQPLPALMCTCKQTYQHMLPHVHGQATMRIEITGRVDRRIGFAVYGKLRFERLRKLWLLVPLERPMWNSWLYFFAEVVRRCRNLETLVVDWSPRPVQGHNWEGRVNRKKEDEFLKTIESLERLHTVKFHGTVPDRWVDQLRDSRIRILRDSCRWWREPGMDA